jgi:ribosomal protein L11 methyltransferase
MKASSTGFATRSTELVRLGVIVPAAQADWTLAAGCTLLGTGCRELTLADGRVRLEFWVPSARADAAAGQLETLVGQTPGAVCERADEDPGWQSAMRSFHQPVDVEGRIRVRPPWHAQAVGPVDVVIDPAMAFGTGQHDTTRGCLELLLRVAPGPVIDIGCGSGVLAIAAAKLGFGPVWAWDVDPLAVAATVANAGVNGVALIVGERDVLAAPIPAVGVVLANLTTTMLMALADAVAVRPPATAILSGMRLDELVPVCEAWSRIGLTPHDRRVGIDWCSVLLTRQ